MCTVMYKFESFIRGARGDVCDGDAGVDFGGAGVSMRGIGVGEGKLWDIVMALRNCAGAAISEEVENNYLSVYKHPSRRGLNPLFEEECAIWVSCLRRQMCLYFLPLDDPITSVPVGITT
jgi:hypothetical protein